MRRAGSKILAFLFFVNASAALAQMKIHVIDVGQADSSLLEFKKAAVLIDAGGESTGDDRDKEHLLSVLNDFFKRRTDLSKTLHVCYIELPQILCTRSRLPFRLDIHLGRAHV